MTAVCLVAARIGLLLRLARSAPPALEDAEILGPCAADPSPPLAGTAGDHSVISGIPES
jgi:hypothetical protein